MSAVAVWARLDVRRRWRSLVVLTLLVALSGGVILSTAAGARRTHSALTRLEAKTLPADVMVLPNDPNFDWSVVRKLPSVAALGTFALTLAGEPQGVGFDFESVITFPPADNDQSFTIDRPTMLSGRRADPHNPNEIVVSPDFVATYGKVIAVRLPSPAQTAKLRAGTYLPPDVVYTGPLIHLHVVGVGLDTFALSGISPAALPTHAFLTKYIKPYFGYFANARVRLHGGTAAIPEFTKELANATGNPNLQVDNWYHHLRIVQKASNFTATSWLLFAGIALIASLILIGQAFVRFSAASANDLATLSALGFDQSQVRRAAAVGPLAATFVGTMCAVGAAIPTSTLFPTALTGRFEPTPGVHVDVLVLGLGALALLVIGGLGAWVCARSAVGTAADPRERPSLIASTARRLGLGVTTVLGTRFALEPGRGRTRVPVRPALIGAVAGVIGVVGALTFRTGLSGTADDLGSFGQNFDYVGFVSEGAPPPGFDKALNAAAQDPDIAVLDDMRVAVVTVNSSPVTAVSLTPLRGQVDITTLSGHAPTSASEISVGPQTAKDLDLHVGESVTVGDRAMTVSGITFVPQNPHNDYTDGAWLTTDAMNAVLPDLTKDKFHEVRLNFVPGVNTNAAIGRLPHGLADGVIPATDFIVPDQQVELKSITVQPLLLGGFLVLLALGAVGHGLATAVRRRRHDVAVLRSLGLTKWQTRMVIVAQATVLALVGLAAGIPLGIAVGRTGWRELAHATPVVYVAPIAVLVLLLAAPITIAAANVLAALPARRAVRMRVSEILRAE